MAWLRRLEFAELRTSAVGLPEKGEVLVGAASPESIALHPGRTSAPRHARLLGDGAGWRLEPYVHHTALNGERLTGMSRPLRHGDLLWFGQPVLEPSRTPWLFTAFLFEDRAAGWTSELEAAVRAAPDDVARVHVWADALQEHGDPFGEHLALALAGRLEPTPWLDGLGPEVERGGLELEWRHGLIRRATLRTPDPLWEYTLTRVLALRACLGLEALQIDLPTCLDVPGPLPSEAIDLLLSRLSGSPLPASVRSLSFGYQTEGAGAERSTVRLPPERQHLAGLRLFARGVTAQLVVARIGPAVQTPLRVGQRVPLEGALELVRSGDSMRFEPPDAFRARSSAARFAIDRLQWRVRGTGLELNGRACSAATLLDGDRVSIGELGLRFELAG